MHLTPTEWLIVERLVRNVFPATKRILASKFRIPRADSEDAMGYAAIATCTRDPLPTDIERYFLRVAGRRALRTRNDTG